MTTEHTLRRRIHEILDEGTSIDLPSRLVDFLLVLLILLNVVAVMMETVDSLRTNYRDWFWRFEVFSVTVFTVEYAVRLWVAPEARAIEDESETRARVRWARSPGGIIDLLAILPFYFSLFVAIDLRFLRIFRLIRFFKLARYSTGLRSLFRAVYAERHALAGSFIIMIGLIVTAASLAYLAERHVQPEAFGSIPAAIWWAVAALTTVGFGDVVPITPLGKMLGVVVMMFGFAMFAVPVGIVATAFANEIHRRDFVVTWSMVARVPLFKGLNADEISEIMSLLEAKAASHGEVLARAGEVAHSMYFVVSGKIEVRLPDRTLEVGEGGFFGEVALLRKSTRSATAIAVSRSQLLILSADDLRSLMHRRPEISKRVHAVASERSGERLTPDSDMLTEELTVCEGTSESDNESDNQSENQSDSASDNDGEPPSKG